MDTSPAGDMLDIVSIAQGNVTASGAGAIHKSEVAAVVALRTPLGAFWVACRCAMVALPAGQRAPRRSVRAGVVLVPDFKSDSPAGAIQQERLS